MIKFEIPPEIVDALGGADQAQQALIQIATHDYNPDTDDGKFPIPPMLALYHVYQERPLDLNAIDPDTTDVHTANILVDEYLKG